MPWDLVSDGSFRPSSLIPVFARRTELLCDMSTLHPLHPLLLCLLLGRWSGRACASWLSLTRRAAASECLNSELRNSSLDGTARSFLRFRGLIGVGLDRGGGTRLGDRDRGSVSRSRRDTGGYFVALD